MVMNYSGSKRVHTNYYGFVSLLLFLILSCATAQSPPNLRGPDSQYEYANFSPSMAIILVILIAALFFMGFFSIYIRNCSQSATGNSIRQALSMRLRAAARGLDASVLQTFPTFTYAEVKDHHYGKEALECAICLNEFEDIEMLRLIPKCDHVFHPECVDAWLESHVTCPVCRADLTPQPDDPPVLVPVLNQQQNEEVSIHIVSQIQQQQAEEGSVNNQGTNQAQEEGSSKSGSNRNRKWPSRSFSMKRPRMFSKFRSHSTGHSLVVPGENLERYTLRLPEDVRKEVMNRAWLNRTKSCAVRSGNEEGSSRGGRSYRRIERNEPEWKSDRWVFTLFSRAKPDNEGSTSRGVKMPSFKCLEPKGDEASLVSSDTARPPV